MLVADAAREQGEEVKLIKFTSSEEARNAPSPFTIYSLFHNGDFVTNEILSVPKFIKLLKGTL
jgi:hypothetical protein